MARNNIQEGEVFVQGKTSEKARELLAAAQEQGVDVALVRTANGGFIVPESLVDGDKTEGDEPKEPEAAKAKPEESKGTTARQSAPSTGKKA